MRCMCACISVTTTIHTITYTDEGARTVADTFTSTRNGALMTACLRAQRHAECFVLCRCVCGSAHTPFISVLCYDIVGRVWVWHFNCGHTAANTRKESPPHLGMERLDNRRRFVSLCFFLHMPWECARVSVGVSIGPHQWRYSLVCVYAKFSHQYFSAPVWCVCVCLCA